MKIDFDLSWKSVFKCIGRKTFINGIVFIIGLVLYKIIGDTNRSSGWLNDIKGLSVFLICVVFACWLYGIFGVLLGITIVRQTYNAQLEAEDNTITFMRVSDDPFIPGSFQIGAQAWHMEEVTSVEEHSTYYLIKGKGIHVPDTRIMSDRKNIKKLKIPKWFKGMEELKEVLKYGNKDGIDLEIK